MAEISVIMAVYNMDRPNVLDLAINSILKQSFTDFEFIICDDGSTDGTFERLQEYSTKDPRIILLRNDENKKTASARNRCLKKARGRYIAIMDADDCCDPKRLEQEYAFLEKNKGVAFVGTRSLIFENTPTDGVRHYWYCKTPNKKDFLFTNPFVHASILFRAEVIRAVGGYHSGRLTIQLEDYDLLMRLYIKGYRGYNLQEVLYQIRLNDDGSHPRKYRYRVSECLMKLRHFTQLHLMPKGIIFAIKPLCVGFIPRNSLEKLKQQFYEKRNRFK